MSTSLDIDRSNTGLFYDAYYSSVVESSASYLARQVQRPRLERLNPLSMARRAYRDPFQIIYDGLSVKETGTFNFHLDVKVVRDIKAVYNLKAFPVNQYESINKDLPPFIPSKPTLPALHSALGSISYDIFGFPTHRPVSRCLPDDCVLPDSQCVLDPFDRIISRPTHPSETYNNLGLSAASVEFLKNAPQSVTSTVNFIFSEDVFEIGSSSMVSNPLENTSSESSPLVTASDASSGGSDSTVNTPLDTPPTVFIETLQSPSTSTSDINVKEEIINGSSDILLGKPFNWVEAGILPPPIQIRRYD